MLISVLCAILVGKDLLRTWERRSSEIDDIRRNVGNLTRAQSQQAESVFRLAASIVTSLAERVETDGAGPAQLDRLRQTMARRMEDSPILESLSVIDETGTLLADGRPNIPQVDASYRPFFQYHKTNSSRELFVSTVLRSRISGKLVIALSIRTNHPDGSFSGVAVATIALEYFQRFYATLDLGRDGIASMYRDDGIVLMRHPYLERVVGMDVRDIPLFRDWLPKAPSGTFEMVSTIDSVTRMVGYSRIPGYPLVVVTALGKSEQLTRWRTGATEHLLATIVAALLLGCVSVRLVGQLKRLTRAERATAAAMAKASAAAFEYRLIADNVSDMVVVVDAQFNREYVSPGSRALLGYEPEELIGKSVLEKVHPEDAERVAGVLHEVAAGWDHNLVTYRLRHRDGSWVWVEGQLRLMQDPDNVKPPAICKALHDITRRQQIEAEKERQRIELERSNNDLAAFAYSASHDLKAPLRAIAHLAEWIGDDIRATASPETLDHLQLLMGRTQRLQQLLDGLLTYSRIGHTSSACEGLDIAKMVHDITAMSPPPPGFVVRCEERLPVIYAHRTPLRIVLDNLIDNSIKHHDRAEGCVTVAMHSSGGVAEFRVSDDGPGIPPEFHDRIFQIFQTLASRDDVEGSGVGLAIVKKMIEVHGGRIWVESEPPGRGTTVVFTWKEGLR